MPTRRHHAFRIIWRTSNLLLAGAFVALIYTGGWEYSVRRYLDGFSGAIVPNVATGEQKVEAILRWMRVDSSRAVAANADELAARDPEMTLNYKELLSVCGTATNAFLNLARSSDLQVRRLMMMTPDRNTKHVVAEVLIGERWIIVDPVYRAALRDAQGQFLTRQELQNPTIFEEAVRTIPNYPREYTYDNFAHVRVARLPLEGLHLRSLLDRVAPGWDESVDWSLLLERESFFYLVLSAAAALFFLLMRAMLGWYADPRLRIPRFHLRAHMASASAALFSTPEIKQ